MAKWLSLAFTVANIFVFALRLCDCFIWNVCSFSVNWKTSRHNSQWECHLKKKLNAHIKPNEINDATESVEKCTHINKTDKFTHSDLSATYCHFFVVSKQSTKEQTVLWKLTNPHSLGYSKATKNQTVAALFYYIAVCLTFIENCTCQSPHLWTFAKCIRSECVFRLRLDRSKLLKLHDIATAMRFFIMKLNSGLHSNDSVVTEKKITKKR